MHEIPRFLIVHDFPPAKTWLPVTFDPPLFLGSEIRTVMVTIPVFADEVTDTTVGEVGLLMAVWALDDSDKPSVTVSTNKTKRPLFTRKASHGTYVPATLRRDLSQCQ